MSTYREVVAMVQDLLKNESDDRYYTDDHIVYLFNKYRALFLFQYYKGKDFSSIPDSNKQIIRVNMERKFDEDTGKITIKSKEVIPTLVDISNKLNVYIPNNPYNFRLTFVSLERFPFTNSVGYLSKIIYMTKGTDDRLEISSQSAIDPSYIKELDLKGIFEDTIEASKLSKGLDDEPCEDLDLNVYLESKLVNLVIKSIVQDLSFGLYRPKDNINNAKDDLSNSSVDNYLRNQRANERNSRGGRRRREEEESDE